MTTFQYFAQTERTATVNRVTLFILPSLVAIVFHVAYTRGRQLELSSMQIVYKKLLLYEIDL